jgi:hypothetical protein
MKRTEVARGLMKLHRYVEAGALVGRLHAIVSSRRTD